MRGTFLTPFSMSRPAFIAESYAPSKCCGGVDCWAAEYSTAEQPCWGEVSAVAELDLGDGDFCWVHGCEGHTDFPDSTYTREPKL